MELQTAGKNGSEALPSPELMPTSAEFQLLALDKIHESPTNPRRFFDTAKEAELEASVREKGVLVPIKVRPAAKGYEIVYGARRFRAARSAGRTVIPALVQVLSDKEVLEEQMIENLQREGVHPLEEADGYHNLIVKHGYTGQALATKVGKSPMYISGRLKLRELGEAGRKAFLEGKISASIALLIARIPAQLQARAVQDLTKEPFSSREAAEFIQENFMLRLEEAPFSKTDAELVKKAGPCTTCPKRTGNQRELFNDVKSPDVCSDPICYRAKVDAIWLQKVAAAKASGLKVLEPAESKKVFSSPFDGTAIGFNSGYVDAHEGQLVGPGPAIPALKLLGEEGKAKVVLARDEKGHIRELLPRKLVDAATSVRQAKDRSSSRTKSTERTTKYDRELEEHEKKQRLRALVVNAAIPAVVARAERAGARAGKLWVFVAERVLQGSFYDGLTKAARRREIKATTSKTAGQILADDLHKMSADDVAALVVEVIAFDGASGSAWGGGYGETFKRACAAFGVDLKKLEAQIAKAAKEKAAAKSAPAKKARGAK